MTCDASDYAMGEILGQRRNKIFHAIYYASRTLNETQLNYAIIEKVLLNIVLAFNKFRPNLIGNKVRPSITSWLRNMLSQGLFIGFSFYKSLMLILEIRKKPRI